MASVMTFFRHPDERKDLLPQQPSFVQLRRLLRQGRRLPLGKKSLQDDEKGRRRSERALSLHGGAKRRNAFIISQVQSFSGQ
jgi:hypothetical protein